MTSTEKILTEKFEQSRIVCWRDKKSELHDEFAALNLPGVEKIEVRNNEFSILYRVLRAEPDTRFLIFTAGEEPPENQQHSLPLVIPESPAAPPFRAYSRSHRRRSRR